jgi:hypothetical protein
VLDIRRSRGFLDHRDDRLRQRSRAGPGNIQACGAQVYIDRLAIFAFGTGFAAKAEKSEFLKELHGRPSVQAENYYGQRVVQVRELHPLPIGTHAAILNYLICVDLRMAFKVERPIFAQLFA